MSFYAVARGRIPGVFSSWAECQTQVSGFQGAKFKKFTTAHEAQKFVAENPAVKVEDAEPPAPPDTQKRKRELLPDETKVGRQTLEKKKPDEHKVDIRRPKTVQSTLSPLR